MNEWYAKDTSNKIKSIFDAKMKDGIRCSGSIPYGYCRVKGDKQTLIIDEEAAEVVRRIFLLANEGKSPREIAEILKADKVLIPAAYTKKNRKEQYKGTKFSDPYQWGISTVRTILDRREYLGHTILHKSVGTNFKLHKRRDTTEEEQYVFYDSGIDRFEANALTRQNSPGKPGGLRHKKVQRFPLKYNHQPGEPADMEL